MKRVKSCKFCGLSGLTWAGRPGEWYLVNAAGDRHVCNYKQPHEEDQKPEGDETSDGLDGLTKPELVRAAHAKFGPSAARWLMRKGMTNEIIVAAIRSGNEPDVLPDAPEVPEKPVEAPNLEQAIVDAIRPHLPKNPLDEAKVRVIARDEAETVVLESLDRLTKEIIISVPDKGIEPKNVGRQHKEFERIVKLVNMREHTWLVGPAGGGKTMGVENAASAVGLKFWPYSMGKMTTQSELWGYHDANGRYVKGVLRDPYEFGGVILLDELDNANDNVITKMNAMLANGYATFPDGVIKRHEDCVVFAAGNTYGRGADALYIGRQQLDAATLDRFTFVLWDYDEGFERDIVLDKFPAAGKWVEYVQKVRAAVQAAEVRHVVSPRASLKGAKLLANGFPQDEVEAMVLWKGLGKDDMRKVKANLRA